MQSLLRAVKRLARGGAERASRRTVFVALAAALACACLSEPLGPQTPPPLQVTIKGLSFELVSGAAAVSSGVLTFYLSDQVDTCVTQRNVRTGNPPVGIYTVVTLRVAAGSDGSKTATVVAPTVLPGPGQAAGGVQQLRGGTQTFTVDASDGAVAWTLDGTGNAVITAIDLGFTGTADRLTTTTLNLPACTL